MMQLDILDSHTDIRCAHRLAGRYHHRHAYKPHVHPLHTPGGHCVSLDNPHDHRHHRGLMYSLRFADCNFFEEVGVHGVQRHVGFEDVVSGGDEIRFTHLLEWRSVEGDDLYFTERRTISCRHEPARQAFVWQWRERLEAQRDGELIKSPASRPAADGTPINYHGMCIRLRRDFSGPANWFDLTSGNDSITPEQAHGRRLPSIMWIGRIDGTLPIERAAVTLSQEQDHALFLLHEKFGFMSMGPSNLEPVPLKIGDVIEASYRIDVTDVLA